MPRLESGLGAAGAAQGAATATTRLVDRDIREMTDDELLAAIQTLAGARRMSSGASRRPAAAASQQPQISASSISDDDIL